VAKTEKAPEAQGTKKESKKEVKAAPARRPSNTEKPNFFQRMFASIKRYIQETMGELRKVNWPTRQEAWYLTKIVIVVVIIMSITLGFLDYFFSRVIGLILQ
jgi:preprotein translocase subunit SecE